MSQLTDRIKAKYPQYANVPDAELEQKVLAKYPQYQPLASKGNWLTGRRTSLAGKVIEGASNILNIPSYAVGGVLNRVQKATGSKYGQGQDGMGTGIFEGIKNKRSVFTEAPESLGVDPNSALGMAIGFGGELLTPNLPIGKLAKLTTIGKNVGVAEKFGKIAGRVAGVGEDAGRTLLEKSYKLSASDINKIADAIGVTDESQKAIKVIDYLERLGLKGSNRGSLKTLNAVVENTQKPFNALVRTGGQVSRQPFIDELLNAAIEAEKADTPSSRILSQKLFSEALDQSKKIGVPLTDTDLTNRISKLFSEAGDSAIGDPASSNLSKGIAKAGQAARETLRPGSAELGRTLRGLRETQDVIGRKANTGLGTQLVNAFKPSALGFGVGAASSYSSGNNPFIGGVIGTVGASMLNRPGVLNATGKILKNGVRVPKVVSTFAKQSANLANKAPVTGFRLLTNQELQTKDQQPSQQQEVGQFLQEKSPTYQPPSTSIPRQTFAASTSTTTTPKPVKQPTVKYTKPKSPFTNKSSFGRRFSLKSGSFN